MDAEASREWLEQIRVAAVRDYQQDAPGDAFYGYLLRGISQSALDHAVKEQIEPGRFKYDVIDSGMQLVRDTRFAFGDGGSENSSSFWKDYERPLDLIRADKVPSIDRSGLEASVGEYLALPYRAQAMDSFLVRALIAMELYAFGDEMLNEKTFGIVPARSPLKQRHVLLKYLLGNVFNAIVFGGVAAASIWASSAGLLGETATFWIAGICVALFLLFAALTTILLPFAWVRQAKARRTVYDLLATMNTLYNEQRSDGPVSSQYVYDRAKDAAAKGVVWPAPLFALLDDIQSRSGRY
ncbi:hypothetical protein MA20_12390 [Bradyrhizobium japonicum]|uniref:Uncharacterized protein n=1 Tax=Bradyrhizobium japonicum TaxID=375 RepID=A0A0A3XZ24_BRAJP|nr:hypothetical protein [Bradyrhizobium japonicum]KGT79635.1 hypothetical protein MA20_12390 [Bradyrhizobium japonicum]